MRSRKARPDVHVELMLDSDGSWTNLSKGHARRLDLTKVRVREIRVRVGVRTWWSLDVESAQTARAAMLEDIVAQASKLGVDFQGLYAALRSNLHWTENECLALALAFTFPSPIVWDRARIRVRNPGAGRPPVVDATWHALMGLARAWASVTGRKPGTGPNALFVTAIEAAEPFLKLGRRGKTSGNIRKLLERERNKLQGKKVRWLFPAPRSRLTLANFTTSKPEKSRKK